MYTKLITLIVLTVFLGLSNSALAEKTYIYKEADGTVWYSNIAPSSQDSTRYKLVDVKGRSTATASCKGMTKKKLANRAADYQDLIKQYSSEFRVDEKLVTAVIRNESCFDKSATSPAGAEGLMQLMPATARSLGVTDSFEPHQNLRGGVQYLSELVNRYHNNLALALAAYNAGPGAVAKYDGVPPYPETQKYIQRVMDSYRDYLREYLIADK